MNTVWFCCRALLIAVFAVAGIAKLADRTGSKKALADFGVPAPFTGPGAILVPSCEVVIAILLAIPATSQPAAWAALAMFALFAIAMTATLAKGKHPPCHCFGQLYSKPVGASSVARLALFAALSLGIALYGPGELPPGALTSPAFLLSSVVALFVLVLLQGWLLTHLVQQNGRLLGRMDALEQAQASRTEAPAFDGLPLGAPAPVFTANDLDGAAVSLADLLKPARSVLMVFTDPECKPCSELLPDLTRWQTEHAEQMRLTLISRGAVKANRAKIASAGIERLLLQQEWEIGQAYQAKVTPSAVLILPNGTIGSPVLAGPEMIRNFVDQFFAPPPVPTGLPEMSEAPEFKLPDLEGSSMRLGDYHGRKTVVIFFNPRCGYCVRMAPKLAALTQDGGPNFAEPLVITTGALEDNRELTRQHDLRCPVLLQREMEIAQLYQCHGTPMGYLIDEEGRIASPVTIGAEGLLALIRPPELVPSAKRNGAPSRTAVAHDHRPRRDR